MAPLDLFRRRKAGAPVFDADVVEDVRGRLQAAPVQQEPFTHLVLDSFLPGGAWKSLATAVPPVDEFTPNKRGKNNFEVDETDPYFAKANASTRQTWLEMRDNVFANAVAPVIAERFRDAIRAKYDFLFGPELAAELVESGLVPTKQRIMARRPGYTLDPHSDPAHFAVTCLIYFSTAKAADAGALCLFRPKQQPRLLHASTYYPSQEEGIDNELVATIPIHENMFVAFLNGESSLHGVSVGKHDDDFIRIASQTYLIPQAFEYQKTIDRLPADARARWDARSSLEL